MNINITKKNTSNQSGYSFFELLMVLAIIAALAGLTMAFLKPADRFAKARNNQRMTDITIILNAIGQRAADNRGVFETGCAAGAIPTTAANMTSTAGGSNYNIGPCLVSAYLTTLPFDPKTTGAQYTNTTNYDTKYSIVRDATTGRITVSAPNAELSQTVSVTR